ncbi:anaerobic benzoate catabolism transcriptional regulator [Mannheimia haemolytica]|uniref:Anaerobic benzoate catabolism transcriptional regulator n=1 Tax=Mannheimia haemolytica TaxID=75985 RepID=A0A448TE06_MANHA|nr:helix-turn-helix transcriptional regulator [Mannheimia haemolytica]UQX67231.1 helix-turn-helix domain-containing protein [Mannheimia haemolytica]STY62520.1 anaerobic benzoate catabolism transcriptional regulator [Mannheimia haemolytica]VEI78138.1 anaerobic benzoate catabolism transcriptional regulator [Mannheimia haemolytica]
MNVNEKVRFLREARGWSQEEMAERVGLSVQGYAKIERGETQLSISRLRQICEVLNYDLLELMALGEKNIVYFQESGNNHCINIVNPTDENLASEIALLKQTISHQAEIIEMQKAQIETLNALVVSMKRD